MSKGFKVRRTKSKIYRRNRSTSHSPLGVIAVIVLLVGLFVLGWFVYQPVYDFITGNISRPPESSSVPEPEPEPEPTPEPLPEPEPEAMKLLYAPNETMKNPQALEEIAKKAQAAGCNTLLFEVKNNNGDVLYKTNNEIAIACDAVVADALDLNAVTETLAKYNLKPAVRLHTMKDHVSSRKRIAMSVHYLNTEGLWLDNYVDKGGRSWLNPYDTTAQDYNIELARECVDAGAVLVIADSVQFPKAIGMNLAGYGDTGGKTWSEALNTFATRMNDAVTEKGASFAVATVGTAVTQGYKGLEYLGSPLQYTVPLVVNSMPAYWAGQTPAPNDAPAQLAGETLRATLSPIKAELIPYVQCYTDSTIAAAKNKEYTQLEIDEQIAVLKELGIESYILYSPDGVYP